MADNEKPVKRRRRTATKTKPEVVAEATPQTTPVAEAAAEPEVQEAKAPAHVAVLPLRDIVVFPH